MGGLVVLLILAGSPAAAQYRVDRDRELAPPPYDPLLGMEPSGRIPKVPLPPDLPEPERWRYVPEGRIKPGNLFERLLVTSFVTPQIFYQQDVGVGGGVAVTDIDFRSQRRQEFLGAFVTQTTEGQERYRLIWRRWLYQRELPEGGVLQEERSFVGVAGGYERTLTRRFFGLGPDTRPSAESSYTDEVTDLGLRADLALPGPGSDWVGTLGLRGEHHNLAPGRVSGIPTTNQAFPSLFDQADGNTALALTAGLRYDTRDSQHQPYSGWRVGAQVDAPVWQDNGDAGAVVSTYANVAFRVPPLFHSGGDAAEENPPTDVVALGAEVDTTVGDLPFFDLPSLGGPNTLRGYIANRFTDRAAWHAVAEYRFWVIPRGFWLVPREWKVGRAIRIERLGLALFGEAGTVAHALEKLPDARIHTSYGIGFRVALERAATFRADLGFSGEGPNFTLAFGLSF
jgi:Omp85 superfamily domain